MFSFSIALPPYSPRGTSRPNKSQLLNIVTLIIQPVLEIPCLSSEPGVTGRSPHSPRMHRAVLRNPLPYPQLPKPQLKACYLCSLGFLSLWCWILHPDHDMVRSQDSTSLALNKASTSCWRLCKFSSFIPFYNLKSLSFDYPGITTSLDHTISYVIYLWGSGLPITAASESQDRTSPKASCLPEGTR